jgi:MoaA/NifB/PqqE/SkfB family radical SAM enzyme
MSINKKTFCVAPWYSIYLNSDKKLAPCCVFEGHFHDYDKIEEYFNSNELKKVRQDLLNGIKNKSCTKCWKDEEKRGDSLRLISNRTIAKETKTNLLNQVKNPTISNLISFDLELGNLCNLKCVMCSPNLSSQLLAEIKLNPELKTMYNTEYDQKQFDWPKGNDFVDWCKRYLPQAIHIRFTGGEPFIIPWIGDVIKRIPDEQKRRCILHFTTNLTMLNDELISCFKNFKEVWLSVSVEGTNETHEYLRYGHSWKTLTDNILFIKNKKIENLLLKINHVLQTPSYHSIIPMVNFFDGLQIEIHPIMLENPKHFHISSLTTFSKKKFLEDTKNYNGFNKNFVQYVRNASQEHLAQNKELAKACIEHLSRFDAVRKNSYKEIIPIENLQHV